MNRDLLKDNELPHRGHRSAEHALKEVHSCATQAEPITINSFKTLSCDFTVGGRLHNQHLQRGLSSVHEETQTEL